MDDKSSPACLAVYLTTGILLLNHSTIPSLANLAARVAPNGSVHRQSPDMERPSSRSDLGLPRASDLLGAEPFRPFLEFERADTLAVGNQPNAWFENRLQEGKPFIIRGFKGSAQWNEELLNTTALAGLVREEGIYSIDDPFFYYV